MRHYLPVLILVAALPALNLLAAPAPDPVAILDIGPPPKGETVEEYRKRLIGAQTFHGSLATWWSDPEVRKLPLVARFKDPRPWMAENLRVTEENERRLRFTFRAGTRAEQVTILNALLRENLGVAEKAIKNDDYWLRKHEEEIHDLETRIKSTQASALTAYYRDRIDKLRSILIPPCRADIARWKQIAVIKWAK